MPWLSWSQLLSQNLEQCLEQNNSLIFFKIYISLKKKKPYEVGNIVNHFTINKINLRELSNSPKVT